MAKDEVGSATQARVDEQQPAAHTDSAAASPEVARKEIRQAWRNARPFADWSEWDDFARTIPTDQLPRELSEARELEQMAISWRRTLEQGFVSGIDAVGIDSAHDTSVVRGVVGTLHKAALARLGGASTPGKATERRQRIAFMRYIQLCVDRGFAEWPDLDRLKAAEEALTEPIVEGPPPPDPLSRRPPRRSVERWRRFLPPDVNADDARVLVAVRELRNAFEELPVKLRNGLKSVEHDRLDRLFASWSETRGGGHNSLSKYVWLRRVLRAAVNDRTEADKLEQECKRQNKGARRMHP